MSLKHTYDYYFAAPFFRPDQIEREEALVKHLRGLGFRVFSPKENCFCPPNASLEDRRKVFRANLDAIRESRQVFAITDGKDVGTIWECGYAYGNGKDIVYFCETLGNNPFNLMLAQSGVGVFTDRSQLTYENLTSKTEFKGEIE